MIDNKHKCHCKDVCFDQNGSFYNKKNNLLFCNVTAYKVLKLFLISAERKKDQQMKFSWNFIFDIKLVEFEELHFAFCLVMAIFRIQICTYSGPRAVIEQKIYSLSKRVKLCSFKNRIILAKMFLSMYLSYNIFVKRLQLVNL